MRAFDAALSVPWLITHDALRTLLAVAARDNADLKALALEAGTRLDHTHTATRRGDVAVIPVTGPIFRHANLLTDVSGATSTDAIAQDFAAALADPSVRAILLDVDSPGGAAAGIHELAAAIHAARGTKPLTAYVGGTGCSAAYWLASACDEIVCDATAVLGSIGAVMAVPAPDDGDGEIEFVSSVSPRKRADPTTKDGAAQYQSVVDALGDVFAADVARHRGVEPERVLADFGRGGVLVGIAAVEAGLADRLGNFEATARGLNCPAARPAAWAPAGTAKGPSDVKLSEMWAGFWAGAKDAGIEIEADSPPATPAAAAQAVDTASAAEIARLRAQLDAAAEESRRRDAEAFAAAEIAASRAVPAEREHLVSLYAQAAADDAAHGGERVTALQAAHSARPAHQLTTALLPEGDPVAVVANATTTAFRTDGTGRAVVQAVTPEEQDRLLSLTNTGRAVLAERRKGPQAR